MTIHRCLVWVGLLTLILGSSAAAQQPPTKPAEKKLPLTGLPPSKIFPDLCVVHYRVSTHSLECQAYLDQGLGFFYSYVWMEAARSFETATQHDPECALA